MIHHAAGVTYLVDLGSGHGTLVDGVPLQPLRPTLISNGSMIKYVAAALHDPILVLMLTGRSR